MIGRPSQGQPPPGVATHRIHHSQGEPLYSVSERFINQTFSTLVIIILINSNFYLHYDFSSIWKNRLMANPDNHSTVTMIIQHIASIYTVFFSSIQRLFQLRIIIHKFHFYWCKPLFSSFQILFIQRVSVVNRTSIWLDNYFRQSSFLRAEVMENGYGGKIFGYRIYNGAPWEWRTQTH